VSKQQLKGTPMTENIRRLKEITPGVDSAKGGLEKLRRLIYQDVNHVTRRFRLG
jgi:hypothetical protein